MKKIDLKKEMKTLYQPSAKEVVEVDVPPLHFLMIDGEGDPNTAPAYAQAVEALFAVAYAVKFAVRTASAVDYGVMPLEGLWWADDMTTFTAEDRRNWKWTMMILHPALAPRALVESTIAEVMTKKKLPALTRLQLKSLSEGKSAQVLHVGPFSAEGPTIERVHRFIDDSGGRRTGKHHEIYLTDIRKASPARWKTIIRQPFVAS